MLAAGNDRPRKDWVNIVFLTITPILGIPVLAWHTYQNGFALWMPALFLVMYTLVGLSICAGYHRCFSHRSYECSKKVQLFYAIFGAMAAQNSILQWTSGHRMHHAHVDSDWDPYSINRGFWWAHVLWIFYESPNVQNLENVRDLKKNPIVLWQDRWYRSLLLAGGFGIPILIGAFFGDPIAGLLWGGFLRVLLVHHSTFFVNSLAHRVGSQTYNAKISARDNWLVALLTFGEGYHSFHHRFPSDFRNGVRWYHWDPAKWLIRGLRLCGLVHGLRTNAPPAIEEARLKVAAKHLEARLSHVEPSRIEEIKAHIARAKVAIGVAVSLWRRHLEERKEGLADRWKETRRAYHEHLRHARQEWHIAKHAASEALKHQFPTRAQNIWGP